MCAQVLEMAACHSRLNKKPAATRCIRCAQGSKNLVTWLKGKRLPERALRVMSVAMMSVFSAAALAGGTYYTDTDNENDAGNGAADGDLDAYLGNGNVIEFNINVTTLPTTSAVLTVYANDVDEESGEIDEVSLNGQPLGRLSGANGVWSSTVFNIDPALLVQGNNKVQVYPDVNNDGWMVTVDWGQLLIDGGAADKGDTGDVEITGHSILGSTVTIDTGIEVNSIAGGDYRLEVSIVAPNGDATSVLMQNFTATAGQTVIRTSSPTYDIGAVTGTYTVQAQLFWLDNTFPVQQDVATTTFQHVQNVGPNLDSDSDGLSNSQETALGTSTSNADTDGDGENDGAEVGGNVASPLDSDGDGVIDALESSVTDTDGDGTPDESDPSNSNPCSPNGSNAACLAADNDGDTLTNGEEDDLGTDRDSDDTDGDGVTDDVEAGNDPANPPDADEDGVSDAVESSTQDTDDDGKVDSLDSDSDNDGIPDLAETEGGTPRDTDGDGIADHLDPDSDNDSIPDAWEMGTGGTPRDTDEDGIPDYRDPDSDNDGIADRLEGTGSGTDTDGDGIDDAFDADTTGQPDMNGDGIGDSATPRDTDNDGSPDYADEDADGDGIADKFESGVSGTDTDADGIDDAADVDSTGGADSNGDGIDDTYVLPDHDADGIPDMFDLDSDNDGYLDVDEADITDADRDGRADSTTPSPDAPVDTDGDGTPDYLDLDSDGDGKFDILTSGGVDEDGDGRIDAGEDSDGDGIPDSSDPAPRVPGTYTDGDGDGVADALDIDLDNDGTADDVEGSEDSDGDGLPNLADLDSDNDGIPDIVENGGRDIDGDGVADTLTDANQNGLADIYDAAVGGSELRTYDTDGDGFENFRDVDSDGDGLSDLIEAGGVDADGNGRLDDFVDANRDGLSDKLQAALGGAALPRPDSDSDGVADGLDSDSDADGVSDSAERNADSDGDGIPDYRDQPGKLGTAVNGVGAFGVWWLVVAGALFAWRRRSAALLALPALCAIVIATPCAEAQEADDTGAYIAADIGVSRLKPENRDGGYVVDDDSSSGFRISAGYAWSKKWAAEAFFVDAGEAGVSSDNASVGHLGDLEYEMYGAGVRWAPLGEGTSERFHPMLKAGLVSIRNEVTDPRIAYDRENGTSIYLGVGAGWRISNRWAAQAEAISYDKDDRFFSIGARWQF
jgi:hypothetical protein